MKVKIQGYWSAEMKSAEALTVNPDELLKKGRTVTICDIIIDGKLVGSVVWDGVRLQIKPP
jgi:hypothetical protein